MTDEELVLRAVQCERPDDPVVRIRVDHGGFTVDLASGERRWGRLPRPGDENVSRYRQHGFQIIGMLDDSMPPVRLFGAAVFDDGEACCLTTRAGLARLYRRAPAAFDPLDIALLILVYHAYGFLPIAGPSALDWLASLDLANEVPGVTLPRLEGDQLEFWSSRVNPLSPTHPEWVEVRRWRLTGLGGDLDWEQAYEGTIHAQARPQ